MLHRDVVQCARSSDSSSSFVAGALRRVSRGRSAASAPFQKESRTLRPSSRTPRIRGSRRQWFVKPRMRLSRNIKRRRRVEHQRRLLRLAASNLISRRWRVEHQRRLSRLAASNLISRHWQVEHQRRLSQLPLCELQWRLDLQAGGLESVLPPSLWQNASCGPATPPESLGRASP